MRLEGWDSTDVVCPSFETLRGARLLRMRLGTLSAVSLYSSFLSSVLRILP